MSFLFSSFFLVSFTYFFLLFFFFFKQKPAYEMRISDWSSDVCSSDLPIMVANDPAAVRGALLCGEGLMLASDIMVKAYAEKGYIRRVLAGWAGPELELNALFPRGQVTSPKIRA